MNTTLSPYAGQVTGASVCGKHQLSH